MYIGEICSSVDFFLRFKKLRTRYITGLPSTNGTTETIIKIVFVNILTNKVDNIATISSQY